MDFPKINLNKYSKQKLGTSAQKPQVGPAKKIDMSLPDKKPKNQMGQMVQQALNKKNVNVQPAAPMNQPSPPIAQPVKPEGQQQPNQSLVAQAAAQSPQPQQSLAQAFQNRNIPSMNQETAAVQAAASNKRPDMQAAQQQQQDMQEVNQQEQQAIEAQQQSPQIGMQPSPEVSPIKDMRFTFPNSRTPQRTFPSPNFGSLRRKLLM